MKRFTQTLLLSLIFALPVSSHAAPLTSSQVQAILNLLNSFGADSATISNVSAALLNSSTNPGVPYTPNSYSYYPYNTATPTYQYNTNPTPSYRASGAVHIPDGSLLTGDYASSADLAAHARAVNYGYCILVDGTLIYDPPFGPGFVNLSVSHGGYDCSKFSSVQPYTRWW